MENGLSTNTGFKRLENLVQLALAAGKRAIGLAGSGYYARGVATSLAAYTYVAGVITANAGGALGAQDGITFATGDQILVPTGVAATASDAGLYVVTNPGAVGVPFVLTRSDLLKHGAVVLSSFLIQVGAEGTVFKNTTWRAFTNPLAPSKTITIGTTDPRLFPVQLTQKIALIAGTLTLGSGGAAGTQAPILSVNTGVTITRVIGNTTAATVIYAATSGVAEGRTPGGVNTGALVVQACVAAGTVNAADISTVEVTITNQA